MRSSRLLILAPFLFPLAAAAQDYPTGGERTYALQRWEEDYSYLRDPAARDDFFDPIKYIPLNDAGDAYLSFGGQARYRFDWFDNTSFGAATDDTDGFHLQRYLLHADARLGPRARAFVQVNSSFVDGRLGGGRYADADDFDLQQAFLDLNTSDDANPYALLRLGRQELTYGAQRYVSPDDWRNVRRSFDGGRVSLSIPNNTLDVFVTRPVVIQTEGFNDSDDNTWFSGVYNVTALPGVIGEDARSKVELYFLSLNEDEGSFTGHDADTYTLGSRFYTSPGYWDFDVEGNYQFGNVDTFDLSAWSLATEVGYTFETCPMSPRLSAGLDIASGGPDPGDRFNQLFPPTYMYLGHIYLFGRTNLIDAHAAAHLHLTRSLTLVVAHHNYWRTDKDDGLYNLAGGVVREDLGSDERYIGNELDIALYFQLNRHLSAYVGWARFFSGDFIEDTGAAKDTDFFYASATFTF